MAVLRGPRAGLAALLDRWIARRMGRQGRAVRLEYPRIYILPSRFGLAFAATVVTLWLIAVNYSSSLGHMLAFLLVGVGFAAMLHTFRNLLGITVTSGGAPPVHAGETARFRVGLSEGGGRSRKDLGLVRREAASTAADVPARGEGWLDLEVPAEHRGRLRPGRLAVATPFPTGLFRAWSWLEPDWTCLVFPRPETGPVPDPEDVAGVGRGGRFGEGDEDFRGLRRYQPGDSPRHVAWRLVARGQDLHTKQFAGQAPSRIWLDWHALSGMGAEARIARLTRWILDAERGGRVYGLRLPAEAIPPGQGRAHRHRCLEALALLET